MELKQAYADGWILDTCENPCYVTPDGRHVFSCDVPAETLQKLYAERRKQSVALTAANVEALRKARAHSLSLSWDEARVPRGTFSGSIAHPAERGDLEDDITEPLAEMQHFLVSHYLGTNKENERLFHAGDAVVNASGILKVGGYDVTKTAYNLVHTLLIAAGFRINPYGPRPQKETGTGHTFPKVKLAKVTV